MFVKGNNTTLLAVAICTAALLWFLMFSPWTSGVVNFWMSMSISAVILSIFSFLLVRNSGEFCNQRCNDTRNYSTLWYAVAQAALGIALAFVLWGVFWIGDKLSTIMFDFARSQVDNVYAMKDGTRPWIIALLLIVLIGPAEELFWRGAVQGTLCRTIGGKHSADLAFIVTSLLYASVHIWSFNFMLVMAALVAGVVWGFIYRLNPKLLPALIVSHALWDALVFIIIPI